MGELVTHIVPMVSRAHAKMILTAVTIPAGVHPQNPQLASTYLLAVGTLERLGVWVDVPGRIKNSSSRILAIAAVFRASLQATVLALEQPAGWPKPSSNPIGRLSLALLHRL